MSKVVNPFPEPKSVNEEKTKEIMGLIEEQFKVSGKIEFFDMLKFFEMNINNKDVEGAKISAYFCTNALISNKYEKNSDKIQTIREMSQQIGELTSKLSENSV